LHLIAPNGFLAVSTIAGGFGLLTGVNAPLVEMLQDSPFNTYICSGLIFLVIAGGSALIAATCAIRKHLFGVRFLVAAQNGLHRI
jgi:hypothetical protein